MARRRMIYAELFEDEHFGSLSDKAKLLFIACIANADDDGRLAAHEANLRAYAFRYEEISLKRIKELISEIITKMKNFNYYEIDNRFYIEFSKWKQYQYIQSDRYKPSVLPKCIQPVSELDTECSLKVKEVNISKGNVRFPFDEVYCQYPNKVGRKKAEVHFKSSVNCEKDFSDIKRALENYLKSERVKKGFVQNADTWFNNWKDWIEYTEVPKREVKIID